jgi:predicted metalloprotease with PDZ domain
MHKNSSALMRAMAGAMLCLPLVSMSAPPAPAATLGGPPAKARPTGAKAGAAFRGVMTLDVDLTDTRRRIVTIKQRIPVQRAGEMTLLYPQWEAASHAPSISAHRLAGLIINADGKSLAWKRDPARVHAFRVVVPEGTRELDLSFQYLAPLGRDPSATILDGFVGVYWNRMLMYPSGWKASALPVKATVRLPEGMVPATALVGTRDGATVRFEPVALDRLLDSPVFASRHVVTRDVAGGARPVRAHWIAAEAELVQRADTFDARLNAVQRETETVFGLPPYERYDYLIGLDDRLPGPGGIEHATSSEVVLPANLLSEVNAATPVIDVIPHELIHAWNGLWRVPADMVVSTPNEPFTGTLLWVYEGQTEFWSRVIAARAGLRTVEQTLGALALDAAIVQHRAGRRWKSLADSANDPLIQDGTVYWRDWQRREDYYIEGVLFWLDIDARLRRCSHGARGLDDFATRFFSAADQKPGERQRPYSEADVAAALDRVCPGPWTGTLRKKLDAHDDEGVLDGLAAHGWRLVFRDTPTEYFRLYEASEGVLDLSWSVGMTVTKDGRVKATTWNGPAFRAGIVPGTRLKTVDDEPFSAERLTAAIAASRQGGVRLGILVDGKQETVTVDASQGLRYPALERVEGTQDSLSTLLAPRAPRAP